MNRAFLFVGGLCLSATVAAQSPPMSVDRSTQAQRDLSRRQIIEQELAQEQALLEDAREALARTQAQPASPRAVQEKQETVRRQAANVESLNRELARLPAVSVLKTAATAGEDAAGAPPQSARAADAAKRPQVRELPGATPATGPRNPRREAIRAYGNPRLVVFPYDRNNTFPVYLMEGLNTHFEFPEGEAVKTLSVSNCGQDSPFWSCILSEDRRHVWIKPKLPDQTNVGTIVTNRRVYEISLHAVTPGREWYQRVTWDGGWQDQGHYEFRDAPAAKSGEPSRAETKPSTSADPERLHFGYTIEGEAPFRPERVFDDGKFTWIKLAPNVQELPALFVLSGDDVELVNYTQRGDHLLVNRLVPGLLLKLGKAEVKVRNQAYTARR